MSVSLIDQLFRKINSRTVDFQASLASSPQCRQVYRHLFPQLMRLLHIHRTNPAELSREQCYSKVRSLGVQLEELNYDPRKILVFRPRNGPSQHRQHKKPRFQDLSKDPAYKLPDLSDNEEPPTPIADHQQSETES
jgi:hypothetical protein